ncbi:hypothetical protein [Pelosinus propionicus]|uniref:Uncharacterized protein n=1 Tax=Pelosinus propionicus DSM 13327 TaxID=1123291 RepID=A0A1I4LJT5_9FIRM|nr:hypothetical protein [Pelosinus propionicus]SFL91053.1 hypothetical protein SAMN04490355_102526 [Pelosinus propionicus DSM 13327]
MRDFENDRINTNVGQERKTYSLTFGDEKTSHTGLDDIYLEVEERILEAIKFGDPFIFEGSNERGNLFYTIERTEEDYILSVKEVTEETAELLKSTLESVKQLGKEKMEEIMEIMILEEIDVDIKKTRDLPLESSYEEIITLLQELRDDANEALIDNLSRLQEIIREYESDY